MTLKKWDADMGKMQDRINDLENVFYPFDSRKPDSYGKVSLERAAFSKGYQQGYADALKMAQEAISAMRKRFKDEMNAVKA